MALRDQKRNRVGLPAAAHHQRSHLPWRSTLGAKILLLAVGMGLLLLLLFFPLRQIFLAGFGDLERQNVEVDLTRVLNTLNAERDLQEKLVLEYGAWDDTYEFVAHPTLEYIDENYPIEVLADRPTNLVLVVNNAGAIVFGRAVDAASSQEVALPAGLDRILNASWWRPVGSDYKASSAMVRLPDQVLIVSAYPILTSEFMGPVRGTIFFAHALDAANSQAISDITRLALEFRRPDDPQLAAELGAPPASVLGNLQPLVQPVNEQKVVGYQMLADADGTPAVVIRVAKARDIYQREQKVVYSLGLAVIAGGIIFVLVLLVLLDRVFVSRLARLNLDIELLGTSGNLAGRVRAEGHDELAQLANTLNATLSAIEQAQRERQQAQEAASAMNQRFIATVSHELRTPLTPIRGYTELLAGGEFGELSPQQHDILNTILINIKRMGGLVEDVLVVSNLNAQDIVLHVQPTRLPQVVNEAVQIFQATSQQKQIAVSIEADDSLPLVAADERRLHQIIWNLLSNAFKYTYEGGQISLRARLRDDGMVEVAISDTGVGMTPEQQQRLFKPFERIDNPLSIRGGGTGLGLVIARGLVELHGGEIWATSAPGAGSTFSFTLPIAAAGPGI